jgi:hypothetical protein
MHPCNTRLNHNRELSSELCLLTVHHTDADTRPFARFNAAMTATTNIPVDLSQPSSREKQIHDYIWTSDTHPPNPV